MPVTRRSLFGLIGGAIASLGLDGPAKAAAAYAEALERRVRPKPWKAIIYIIDITTPPGMQYNVIWETVGEDVLLARGINGLKTRLGFNGGLVLSEGESLQVRLWKDDYQKSSLMRFRADHGKPALILTSVPTPDSRIDFGWESL